MIFFKIFLFAALAAVGHRVLAQENADAASTQLLINSMPETCIQVPPTMPIRAQWDGIGGVVKAEALIVNGAVKEVTILSGPPVFHEAVREAMMQYQCTKVPGRVLAIQEFSFVSAKGAPSYSIQQYSPTSVASVLGSLVTSPLPLDKSYQQLNDGQKAQVRELYHEMKTEDDPPFPLSGLGKLQNDLLMGAEKLRVRGRLSMHLQVDSAGVVTSVEMLRTPNEEFGRFAASVGIMTPFKPAVCGGQPCAMSFPIDVVVVRTTP